MPPGILFVDDDPGLRDSMPEVLTLHGLEVTTASVAKRNF
jgi:DNA-binding NtrC family response regulator